MYKVNVQSVLAPVFLCFSSITQRPVRVFKFPAVEMRRTKSQANLPESKRFSMSTTNPINNWRIRIKQTQLISQASTILLQRRPKFWFPLLKSLKLSSNFTPSLFHQILNKIETHPQICLIFFKWVKKNLDFIPDLKTQCKLTRILFRSELSKLGKPILNSLIQDYPPTKIVPLLIQSRKGYDSQNISSVLISVIECYCDKQMFLQSLQVYQKAIRHGIGLTTDTCNALLNLLGDKNELRVALCLYASMNRNGISGNQYTWSSIARILCKDGKFERVTRILRMGIYTPAMFNLMIEYYSKRGDFVIAFGYLNEMASKRIEASFSTYSSMLDGACKHKDREVIEIVTRFMQEKGYLLEALGSDYDLIIQKLCDLGKTHAVDLFFKRASDEKIELQHATYQLMLKALLTEEGRVKNAIDLYDILQKKGILLNETCYNEFVIVLCRENPSEEVSNLLSDIIRGGFNATAAELGKYISKQCTGGRWREAEGLLNLILDQGYLLDSLSYGSFVSHYCSGRQLDSAITLHSKLQELNGMFDVASYNVLLAALLKERRIEEATKVFDYMRTRKNLSSESFSLMIRSHCPGREMRKAMKLHDEMLELGLKPDAKTYKRLISGFR